jgi:hypothetical protein
MPVPFLMLLVLGGCGLTLDPDPPLRANPASDGAVMDAPVATPDARAEDGSVRDADAAAPDSAAPPDAPMSVDAMRPDAMADGTVVDAGGICGLGAPSVARIVCDGSAVRFELTVEFPGCDCFRAYATISDDLGTRWTQSDEMLGPRGTVVFDGTDTFFLGGANPASTFDDRLSCVDLMDLPRIGCG